MREGMLCSKIVFKYSFKEAVLKLVESLISAAMIPLGLLYIQRLIDQITLLFSNKASLESVFGLGFMVLIIYALSSSMNLFHNLINISLQRKLDRNISLSVVEKFKKIKYEIFENSSFNDTLYLMKDNPSEKIFDFYESVVNLIGMVLEIAGILILFNNVSVWLTFMYFISIGLIVFFDFQAVNNMNDMFNQQSYDERRMDDLNSLLSKKESLLELKVFNAVQYISDKLKKIQKNVMNQRIKTTIKSQKYTFFSSLTTIGWIGFSIFILIKSLIIKNISIGVFISLLGAIQQVLQVTETMSVNFSYISQNSLEIKHFDNFMNLEEEKSVELLVDDELLKNPFIKFSHVSFTYPNTEVEVLSDINFTIQPHQNIALVGQNGSGKSTLIKLLCRFYEPTSGEITVNEIPLEKLTRTQLKQLLSVVFQDYAKYQLTVRENVAIGDINKLNDDKVIEEIMKFVNIEDVFLDLDQPLGKLEEDGTDLSGGQWQRLAIARACLSSSSIIIFDEPTASLDPIAECDMYMNLNNLLKNRGCIFISHRLASAKMADNILVLDNHKLVEQGSHEQLMASDSLYSKMYKQQSSWFTEQTGGECN